MTSLQASFSKLGSLDYVKVGSALVLLGGGVTWILLKMKEGHYFGQISSSAQICLRKSSAVAVASIGLGSLPMFLMRKLGWSRVEPLYTQFLFSNRYVGILTVATTLLLVFFSIVYPVKKNKNLKYQLWTGTCLSVGMVLAPIFFTPRDLLTIVSGYVLALTVPVATSCAIAPNFLILNVFALLSTTLCTTFAHHIGIPWIINRRHHIEGTIPYIPTLFISTLLLGTVLMTGVMMMINANMFVWYIQKSFKAIEVKKKESQRVASSAGARRPKDKIVEEPKELSLSLWDGTDEVTNGLIIAGYSVFTFFKIWFDICMIVRSLIRGKKRSERGGAGGFSPY